MLDSLQELTPVFNTGPKASDQTPSKRRALVRVFCCGYAVTALLLSLVAVRGAMSAHVLCSKPLKLLCPLGGFLSVCS